MFVELGIRLVAPYLLRQFVRWLMGEGDHAQDAWMGWLLASLLALTAYG